MRYPMLDLIWFVFGWMIVWMFWIIEDSMGKENQSSAMEVDDPKSTNSDQIASKFSINGLCLIQCRLFFVHVLFLFITDEKDS
jgi:hypothetical protein